jgi:ribonuclease HII
MENALLDARCAQAPGLRDSHRLAKKKRIVRMQKVSINRGLWTTGAEKRPEIQRSCRFDALSALRRGAHGCDV